MILTVTSLSLFNLNIMHGRNKRSAVFPPFVSRGKIQVNLQKIVECIKTHNPDIVTLQEVDQGSVLSGGFNQFEWLGERLEYPYRYFAPSCSARLFGKDIFVSGNAIFSRYPLENRESHCFDFSFPTDRMGFVVADVKLPEGKTISVASVHLVYLDWTRRHPRAHQLKLVERVIAARKNSAIISGDLNCGLLGTENSLRTFVKRLNLRAYEPDSKNSDTYPSWDAHQRIDWILTSKDLEFVSYKKIEDKISDHLAVFAEIKPAP